MESEKVKEIKKGLSKEEIIEILKKRVENINPWETHALEYHKGLLDLINELESENERLSNTEIGELIKENEELAKQCEDWCEITLKKRNQIVKLKDRIAELEKENANKTDTIVDLLNMQEFYEKEKLKQFAERVLKFVKEYAFKDSKEIYTNGTILVPLFRVEYALETGGQDYQQG